MDIARARRLVEGQIRRRLKSSIGDILLEGHRPTDVVNDVLRLLRGRGVVERRAQALLASHAHAETGVAA